MYTDRNYFSAKGKMMIILAFSKCERSIRYFFFSHNTTVKYAAISNCFLKGEKCFVES